MVQPGTQLEYLTKNDWMLLTDHATSVESGHGVALIREGQPIDSVFIIRRGTVVVQVRGKTIASLGEGAICGEMGFLEGKPASASVLVESDTVVADRVPATKLKELFDTFPTLGLRFYRSLALNLSKRLRDTSRELAKKNGDHGGRQ